MKKALETQYQEYIHLSRYARWRDDLGRRETWKETVERYVQFWKNRGSISSETANELFEAIYGLGVMPSMRCLMTAGKALDTDNVAGFNCSFTAIDNPRKFDEILYILMCGTGVGFSVERQFIANLPEIPDTLYPTDTAIVVPDSKIGWATSLRELISLLYAGKIPTWDTSRVRPAGAKLKTFGGRASGPKPLEDVFRFIVEVFKKAAGRKLKSIECHDIVCKIAECVVVGGVRRSALISLSNLSDERMRHAKAGQWWTTDPQRSLANNSVCYTERPEIGVFMHEWLSLYNSKSGERGIFNREAAIKQSPERRRDMGYTNYGTNPCSEIVLRSGQFCNLSEVIIRPQDTLETLKAKVRIAAILGTLQASLTNFRYLSKEWKKNTEEEALLGVSLTGIMDHPVMNGSESEDDLMQWLTEMKEVAVDTNKEWAERLGVNHASAITCVKPSGCRPWYALTTTSKGLLTLEELFTGHKEGQEWSHIDGINALQGSAVTPITKTYDNGVSRVLRVTLNYGIALDSTPNHQWFVTGFKHPDRPKIDVVNKWVRADELLPGHIIEVQPGNYRSLESACLVGLESRALSMRGDAKPITQPNKMNADLAWLLGYLWGDGAMSPGKYRIRFIDARVANLEKARQIILDQFGLQTSLKKASEHRQAWTLDASSKMLWHWLIKNGVWKYYADKLDLIPEAVRRSAWTDIVAFMAGMFDADGWAGENGKQTFTTADEGFARHFQHVAWAIGLGFGLSKNVGGGSFQKEKAMYLLTLGKITDPSAFAEFVKHSNKLTSLGEIEWHALKEGKALIPGKVLAIEELGLMPTFDIETGNHWYMAGAVKSHNTVSQLVDSASGIHPRYAPYYIRTVRADMKDPVSQVMIDHGVPHEPDVMRPDSTWVFSFPMKAPESSVFRDDRTAIEQLELWKQYQLHWCEHKPSITVYVKENEWLEVGAWVWEHFDIVSGVSFLPHSEHSYQQAPYQECTKDTYTKLSAEMPGIDWSKLSEYEKDDQTTNTKELACTAGQCEI